MECRKRVVLFQIPWHPFEPRICLSPTGCHVVWRLVRQPVCELVMQGSCWTSKKTLSHTKQLRQSVLNFYYRFVTDHCRLRKIPAATGSWQRGAIDKQSALTWNSITENVEASTAWVAPPEVCCISMLDDSGTLPRRVEASGYVETQKLY